ncbi:MAG TPA: glycosyltransferase family 1 protein [Acidobacteria bacterium]|nr:glycosyltransferase family 1 protein [Acidobacteriota bacterium]
MGSSFYVTAGFFLNIARDLAGTFLNRWRRFQRRTVEGEAVAAVGVDVYPFFERMTGVGWYEWNLLAALDARDDGLFFNLYAHTFLAPDEPGAPPMPGARSMRLRIHHIPPGFLLPVRPTILFLRAFVEPVFKFLDGNDVLFAPNFFPHPTQDGHGRALVATVHDLAFAALPDTVAPVTLADLRRHIPAARYHTDRFIVVSDATRAELLEYFPVSPRRIHTIHEGVDPTFAEGAGDGLPEEVETPYLLFLSTLEPRKNVLGVLRAFELLHRWGYPGRLVLAGRWGWHTEALQEALERSPARDRIVHLDYVPREGLPALYRHADALLFPSWLEGFGLPIVEAMACGTPVITSGRSAMPEVAGPAAVYVDPASAHGIASAVSSLLADHNHRDHLAEQGRRRAAAFSWERAAGATAQVLRQAAGLPAAGEDEYRAGTE